MPWKMSIADSVIINVRTTVSREVNITKQWTEQIYDLQTSVLRIFVSYTRQACCARMIFTN